MPLTQGDPLPNIQTTQTQTTTAPSFYTDYLSNIAGTANSANPQYVGANDLQNQAWNQTQANVGNYTGALTQASDYANQAGNMSAADAASGALNKASTGSALTAANPYLTEANQGAYSTVDKYMSPYIQDVVKQLGDLGQRQIEQSLAPGATSGLVGSGQFGSSRGATALAQTIRDANQNILAQQGQALNTGYQNAMTQAQADLARQLDIGKTAGSLSSSDLARYLDIGKTQGALTQADMANKLATSNQMSNIANQKQALSLADINALATMGAQKQTDAQNAQLFPLQVAAQKAGLLKGYSIPTSVSSTYNGPIPGAYSASPLANIAGVGSLIAELSKQGANGKSALDSLMTGIKGLFPSSSTSGGDTTITDTTGGDYDADGNWVGNGGGGYDLSGNYVGGD